MTNKTQKILLTGHQGYIGSVMSEHLVSKGYEVVGLDTGYYRECTLFADEIEIPCIRKDIRDLDVEDLKGFGAVIHLAALSNDPIGNLNKEWTERINYRASVRLAELAKAAGVRRFLFSSSCIMYGMAKAEVVNEDSPLAPQTEYALSKVRAEQSISETADDNFSPTFLRNGTVYGASPRMRFDTVFNNLIGSAMTTGKITLYSDGKPWRPVVHVEDVSRAFTAVLEAPLEDVHNQAFNVGAEHLNHQIAGLAEIAASTVPGCKVEVLSQPGADQRTYKTDFSKFARTFPNFTFRWKATTGGRDLCGKFKALELSHCEFTDRRFTRLKWLRYLLDTEKLNISLRWNNGWRNGNHD